MMAQADGWAGKGDGRNTMFTLQTNSANLLIRCIAALIVIICIAPFLNLIQHELNAQKFIFWKFKSGHMLIIVAIALAFYLLTVIVSIFGIIRVEVDKSTRKIIYASLIRRTEISANDIDNYFVTSHSNQLKTWGGLILNLKDEKTIQLAAQNLKSVEKFKNYLNEIGVECLGDRKIKFPFN